jgi:hypothetical protein
MQEKVGLRFLQKGEGEAYASSRDQERQCKLILKRFTAKPSKSFGHFFLVVSADRTMVYLYSYRVRQAGGATMLCNRLTDDTSYQKAR